MIEDPYLRLERDGDAVDEWAERQNEYADAYLVGIIVAEQLDTWSFLFEELDVDYGS